MKVDIFTLCDFAQEMSGKLVIVGTFDTIFSDRLPATHRTCSIVARIRFSDTEAGQHSFKISVLDDNSNKEILSPPSGFFDFKISSDENSGSANIVLGITLLQLTSYGTYSVNLSIDEKQLDSLTFLVKKPVSVRRRLPTPKELV